MYYGSMCLSRGCRPRCRGKTNPLLLQHSSAAHYKVAAAAACAYFRHQTYTSGTVVNFITNAREMIRRKRDSSPKLCTA
jgi:hypothetical protein